MHDHSCYRVLDAKDADPNTGVTSVSFSPDGRYVGAGGLDNIIRIWDIETGQMVERLGGHKDSVYTIAFTYDGKGLISGSLDKELMYWDMVCLQAKLSRKDEKGSHTFSAHKVCPPWPQ